MHKQAKAYISQAFNQTSISSRNQLLFLLEAPGRNQGALQQISQCCYSFQLPKPHIHFVFA